MLFCYSSYRWWASKPTSPWHPRISLKLSGKNILLFFFQLLYLALSEYLIKTTLGAQSCMMLSDFSPKWELKWKGNKNINNRNIIHYGLGTSDGVQSKGHDWNMKWILSFLHVLISTLYCWQSIKLWIHWFWKSIQCDKCSLPLDKLPNIRYSVQTDYQ